MRVCFLTIIVLFSATAGTAQGTAGFVFWSDLPECGQRSKSLREGEDLVRCGSVPTSRGNVSTIERRGIGLSVAFLEEGDYYLAAVRIDNKTSEAFTFDADLWGAAHFRAKDGYYRGERPIVAETSIPSRDIIRKMASAAALGKSLDTFMADVQTSPETVDIKRSDGTRFKSVLVKPDKEARSAAANNETREDHTANGQRSIRSIALTAKSVGGGQFIKGIVYFRRIKKANFILFSIKMDGITYLFQLPRGTHRPKQPVTQI